MKTMGGKNLTENRWYWSVKQLFNLRRDLSPEIQADSLWINAAVDWTESETRHSGYFKTEIVPRQWK